MAVAIPSDGDLSKVFPELDKIEYIASGGFKSVFKITIKGKVEALKCVLLPPESSDENERAIRNANIRRIYREIDALSICNSPNLVKLGSVNRIETVLDGKDWIVYSEEFLDGDSLYSLIKTSTFPSESEIKTLFVSILRAIKEMWSHSYIHRDIKPGNIIKTLNPTRPFVLLDLGIAFAVDETALTLNPGGLPPATYRYIAPEMLNPNFRETLDYRSDLYTLALTAFEYASKIHPLAKSGDDLMLSISRAVRETPKNLRDLRTDFSNDFCQLLEQILKKRPGLRPNLDATLHLLEEGL